MKPLCTEAKRREPCRNMVRGVFVAWQLEESTTSLRSTTDDGESDHRMIRPGRRDTSSTGLPLNGLLRAHLDRRSR